MESIEIPSDFHFINDFDGVKSRQALSQLNTVI